MTLDLRLLFAAGLSLAVVAPATAAPILEAELNGTGVNNVLGAAQAIPGAAFTLPVPATVFDPPGYATATVTGAGGGDDVDFYAFSTLAAGSAYFDIDGAGFDTILSLFDSAGTLIGYAEDSPLDPGSGASIDAFLGVIALPAAGTYYLAVSELSFPLAIFLGGATFTNATRPDGEFGGSAISNAAAGESSFTNSGVQPGSPYTLHLSVQHAVPAVPEPASVWLCGAGLVGLMARRVRRRTS